MWQKGKLTVEDTWSGTVHNPISHWGKDQLWQLLEAITLKTISDFLPNYWTIITQKGVKIIFPNMVPPNEELINKPHLQLTAPTFRKLKTLTCHSTMTLCHARCTWLACFHRTIYSIIFQNAFNTGEITTFGITIVIRIRAIWRRWNRREGGLETIIRSLTVTRGRARGWAGRTDVGNHTS